MDWEFEKEAEDEAEYTFEWAVEAFGQTELDQAESESVVVPTAKLLMLALPHHAATLAEPTVTSDAKLALPYVGLKGAMMPVKGSQWTMKEPLTLIDFTAPNGLATAPEKWLSALEQALIDDMDTDTSGNPPPSPLFHKKQTMQISTL